MSSNQVAYAQKRRSSRIHKAIPLAVQGVGACRAPYQEEVTTLSISCHGCTYQMKQEVLPGDIVFLDMKRFAMGHAECSNRARVKWIQKLKTAKDQSFEVAVELEIAGNIWGIASPPEDWFPAQVAKGMEPANAGRELRVVGRIEPQIAAAASGGSVPGSHLKKSEATASSLSPSFSEMMVGLGQQIQVMASETAAATLAKEKDRLLEEFRLQLHEEAKKTLERVIVISKEELARRMLKELNEAQEAAARTNYERWTKTIEQNMESARQRLLVHGKEVSERIDSMAASTMERLQRNIEASRSEAVDRFVSKLREQITPLLDEAKKDIQKLAASGSMFKEESQALCSRFSDQLESSVNARLTMAHDELNKDSATVVAESNEKLLKLSQGCEKATRESLRSLVASATDYTKKILEERTAEFSSQFSAELEGYTRSYFESISKSIAEIPKKTSIHSHD